MLVSLAALSANAAERVVADLQVCVLHAAHALGSLELASCRLLPLRAALGFIVGEQLEDFPLFFNFDGQIQGPAITHFSQVQQGFWEPLLIAIGLAESYRVSVGWATPTGTGFNALKDDYEMGNLGFDPLGLKPTDPEELKEMQTKELNNGRLAMIAIAGFVLQEVAEPGVEVSDCDCHASVLAWPVHPAPHCRPEHMQPPLLPSCCNTCTPPT